MAMGIKHFAALAAAMMLAAPAAAFDDLRDTGPSTMFYLSIPLDARSAKEQMPAFGLQLRGNRAYETVRIDSRMFSFPPLGGLEVKWVVVGGVAVAAAVAAGKKRSEERRVGKECRARGAGE